MARPRHKGKGKRVQKHEAELEKELQWIREKLDEEEAKRAAEVEEELRLEEEGGIECGCCFSEYPFVRTPCPIASRSRSHSLSGQNGAVPGGTPVLHDVHDVVR